MLKIKKLKKYKNNMVLINGSLLPFFSIKKQFKYELNQKVFPFFFKEKKEQQKINFSHFFKNFNVKN